MIHLTDKSQTKLIHTEKCINHVIVPVALDVLDSSGIFQAVAGLYPDLPETFKNVKGDTELKVGDVLDVKVNGDHHVYVIIIRSVEKFQAYIMDVLFTLSRTIRLIKNNNGVNVIIPAIDHSYTKLSNTMSLPQIIDTLNYSGLEMYMIADVTTISFIEGLIEHRDGPLITWKRDAWNDEWMLSKDDVILAAIIHKTNELAHGFTISKTRLIKCYERCHENGMFPKIEFYESEFGKYFKLFMPKFMSLVNHGLIMNIHHYADKPKNALQVGPMYPQMAYMAYSVIRENYNLIEKIARIIAVDHQKAKAAQARAMAKKFAN